MFFREGRIIDVPEERKSPGAGAADRTSDTERYYVVREDLLPETVLKAIRAKELLDSGAVKTIHEAVEQVDISRSAYYKYKDGIYPLTRIDKERIVTISLDLEHRSGILSRVLAFIAGLDGNVLTIHQSIPLQGYANVVISAETSALKKPLQPFMEAIRSVDGVRKALIIGQG